MTTGAAQPLRLLLVGATGVVGREVLRLALEAPRIASVTAPTRRPLPAAERLENPVCDLTDPERQIPWHGFDAVICTLGTTIRVAGSPEAFAAVDRDLPIAVARLARAAGATRFALNSSLGAAPGGNLYLRTKAEAEAGIRAVGYPALCIVRPSLIDAEREQSRPGEQIGLGIARWLRPLIPRRYRPVRPEWIARALLDGVLDGADGVTTIESGDLQR